MMKQGKTKMLSFSMLWPIAAVVLANVGYHIATKAIPEKANAFLSLCVTYGVAALACLILFLCSTGGKNLGEEMRQINWAPVLLGVG